MNLKEDRLWKLVELRSADIPTNWSDRFNWVRMFELIATLFYAWRKKNVLIWKWERKTLVWQLPQRKKLSLLCWAFLNCNKSQISLRMVKNFYWFCNPYWWTAKTRQTIISSYFMFLYFLYLKNAMVKYTFTLPYAGEICGCSLPLTRHLATSGKLPFSSNTRNNKRKAYSNFFQRRGGVLEKHLINTLFGCFHKCCIQQR